jgi:NitT/TauT family transport system ATP-binding protein
VSNTLQIRNVQVEYPVADAKLFKAVEDVSLDIAEGEFVCLVGTSGCGKSTLLNVLAGLLQHTSGSITLGGESLKGQPSNRRAMVFQSAALLPWRRAIDNVSYGLEVQGVDRKVARARAQEMINLVGLSGHEQKFPGQLSGGMQQRVNLARALVTNPDLLLLDEPFAALDAQTRRLMQEELVRIWQERPHTSVLVTHQISEAVFLADKVAVLTRGPARVKEIVEIDLPRPRDPSVFRDPKFRAYEERIWDLVVAEGVAI